MAAIRIIITLGVFIVLSGCVDDGSGLSLEGAWQSADDSRTIEFHDGSYTVVSKDVHFDLSFAVVERSDDHALLSIDEGAGTTLMVRSLGEDRIRLQVYPQPGLIQSEEDFLRVK